MSERMKISIIVAVAENRVIGNGPDIPWDLPDDRRRFREITWGRPVIMGRRTFETLTGPLPGRMNIVLTRDSGYRRDGCLVVHDPEEALRLAGDADEVFICGGGDVYREFLPRADRIYLTIIHKDYEGDVLFPEVPPDFTVIEREFVPAPIPHTFLVYGRVREAPFREGT